MIHSVKREPRQRLVNNLLLSFVLFVLAVPGYAANAFENDNAFYFPSKLFSGQDNGKEWQALDDRLGKIDAEMDGSQTEDEQKLLLRQKEVEALKTSISAYIGTMEVEKKQLENELKTLGEASAEEPSAVTDQRKSVQDKKNRLDGKLVGYRLVLLHSDTLLKKLMSSRQQRLTEEFLARGSNTVS